MRKSPDVSEVIKIKKTIGKKKKYKKLHTSRKKTAFVYLDGGSWFPKAHVVLWLTLVGLSVFARSPVNPCQMKDVEADGLSSQ